MTLSFQHECLLFSYQDSLVRSHANEELATLLHRIDESNAALPKKDLYKSLGICCLRKSWLSKTTRCKRKCTVALQRNELRSSEFV